VDEQGDPVTVRFVFGIHQHQPVGNFDHVFEEHTRDVYMPLLQRLSERDFFPIVMHLSGPLMEWLDAHHSKYLDMVGELVSQGKIEMLLSGYYEPILASLPRDDRVEQIQWMQRAIESRFGVKARGLWLTERVWEPELPADLHAAGVSYVLVDDRHFLVTGFDRNQLHVPWRTESDGRTVDVFAIDERLRYLIPFRPPSEIAAYFQELNAEGHKLALFADDGEKFGGWPGTREWVYEKGWLKEFLDTMENLVASKDVVLSTASDALSEIESGGIAYLPTASYREMEGWSLPPAGALELAKLEKKLGSDNPFIRGSHWKNFLAKYPESNRMHKKMMALSALSRRRGDPEIARRAIGRAQCNDAYWHGVFGGLYLPHLREGIWTNLAIAEQDLRRGESLQAEILDFDKDGREEVWIHSSKFSAVVKESAIVEYTIFDDRVNYADVLTRRYEAYHEIEPAEPGTHDDGDGVPSIHHLEESMQLKEKPPVDARQRAILVDSIPSLDSVEVIGQAIVVCRGDGMEKRIAFDESGAITVSWSWTSSSAFSTELSVARPLEITADPEARQSTMTIETVAKSERGFDRTVQGQSITLEWEGSLGAAELRIRPY
jgi:alpha-amylase